MTTQTLYSGFPAALARGGTFDLGDPVSQWWLSRLPDNPYSTIAAFRLIANVSSSAVDITTITRDTTGYAVVWQHRIEGTFQIDANNARASGTPTVTYQSYTSWNSDGSRGAASYQSTTHASGPPVNGISATIWSQYFEQNSRYQSTQFAGAPNTLSGTFTSNGNGTGTWSLNGGESGTFQVINSTVNSDGSISYRQRFLRSNGSTYGEVQGRVQGGQGNNAGQYSGTWTLTQNNGTYTFRNFRSNGVLVSTGSFQPLTTPTYTVTPSVTTINEGAKLTTSIATTGVASGTTLYYALSGTGITASDFTSGGVSGSIAVGSDGTASILHKLKEDKATEGEESFSIQIFSDKKMRKLVRQSDVVTVVDTSIKAAKPTKPTGNSTKSSQLQMDLRGVTLKSDVVYGKNSDIFRLYTSGLSDEQIDSITGFGYEVELSPSQIVVTEQYVIPKPFTSEIGSVYLTGTRRYIKNGAFRFSNGKLMPDSSQEKSYVEGSIRQAPSGTQFTNKQSNTTYTNYAAEQYTYHDTPSMADNSAKDYDLLSDGTVIGNSEDLAWFRSYEGGKFFGANWWRNPFTPDLI